MSDDSFSNPEWVPGPNAWTSFCKANPALGFKGTRSSWVWFTRSHAKAMIAAGAMRRAASRSLIAHVPSFGKVAFELLTTAKTDEVSSC